MTIFKEKVTVERLKKLKICGEFRENFDFWFDDVCETHKQNGHRIFIFNGNRDIKSGDRLRFVGTNECYDIKSSQIHDWNECIETVAVGVKNDFETGWEKLKKLGCSVEIGVVEPVQRDDATESFMNAWVGTYTVNIAEHYHEIKSGRHIGEFYGLFNHDIPVACVGAGPSLDKNVELLKEFPGLIISVDKAYKMLMARGIDPDFIISVDCHYDLVADMLSYPFSKNHVLILNVCADPKITKVWEGKLFWYLMKHPGVQYTDKILPALFPKFHGLENAGCVGNTSVLFSDFMGLSPVVLVGQDFGYSDGKMHAQRYEFIDYKEGFRKIEVDHDKLLEERTGKVEINGITTYLAFKGYMDTMYALKNRRRINIVNCTEGGILRDLPQKKLKNINTELSMIYGDKYKNARNQIKSIVIGGN